MHRERVPDDLVGEVVQEARSGRNRAARLADMLRVERSVSWADTESDLHLVRVPVLLLWGSNDRYFPVRLIDRFIARLPTVEHHVLADCGHLRTTTAPSKPTRCCLPLLRQDS